MRDPVEAFIEAAGITEPVDLSVIPTNLTQGVNDNKSFFDQFIRHLSCIIRAVDIHRHLSISLTYVEVKDEVCGLGVSAYREEVRKLNYHLLVATKDYARLIDTDIEGYVFPGQDSLADLHVGQDTLSEEEIEKVYRAVGQKLSPYLQGRHLKDPNPNLN